MSGTARLVRTSERRQAARRLATVCGGIRPDFRISLDGLEPEGDELVSDWTCTSAELPGPVSGRDTYPPKDGKIKRLETRLG